MQDLVDLLSKLVAIDSVNPDLVPGGAGEGERVWISATPYVGPAHIGRTGRERYLRKAIRSEWRRRRDQHFGEVEVQVEAEDPATDPMWVRRPRPFEFCRGRSRAGDDGYQRAFGAFQLTFSEPISGPLCLGYGCERRSDSRRALWGLTFC